MATPTRSQQPPPVETALAPELAQKKLLVESLLIALRASEVARVVDAGTLEYFLDSSYESMIHGNALHLSKLWSVLCAEPGIDPRMMFAPLLAFKSWERQLGVQVMLPQPMLILSADERRAYEARCSIQGAELERLLASRRIVVPKPPGPAPAAPAAPDHFSQTRKRGRRVPAALVAAVMGAFVLALGGIAWWSLAPRGPAAMNLGELESGVVLKHGRRSASAMSAVIADPAFALLPPAEQQSRLEALFARAKRLGIRSMFLYDEGGVLRVTAVEGTPSDRITLSDPDLR